MVQMSAVQLKILLNAAYKVVNNVCTLFSSDCLNLLWGPDSEEPVA